MSDSIVEPDKYLIDSISKSLYKDWIQRRPSKILRLIRPKRARQSALSNDATMDFEEKYTVAKVSTVRDRVMIHNVKLRGDNQCISLNESFKLGDYESIESFQSDFYDSWIKGVIAIGIQTDEVRVQIR